MKHTFSIKGDYDIVCGGCGDEHTVTPKTLHIYCGCGKSHHIRYPWQEVVA